MSRGVWKKIAVLMTVTTLAVTGCGKRAQTTAQTDTKNTITVGYLPITHALAVFETKELLESEDADVAVQLQKFSSWTDLMDALNAGKIDAASVLIELAMGAVNQGIDLRAVALGHKDGNVIVVSDEVETVQDLKGKTFAIPSNQSSHNILLGDMLEKADMQASDITITQLAPTEMPSALASHSIDGYCVAEPFGAQAVVQGFGHVLYDSQELWEHSICCALVVRGAFIEEKQELVDQFIAAYYEAGDELSADTQKAKDIAASYLGQDEQTLETSLKWIQYDDLAITKEDYELLADRVIKYGINENPPAYEQFVYQPSGED